MKFSTAALLVLASQATAWTGRTSLPRTRNLLAAQLHSTTTEVATEVAGEVATESFRLLFKEGDKAVSPWHDIPLKNDDGSYNMVCFLASWEFLY